MTDLKFTRRRCIIGGQTAPDDWLICVNGKPVGRVYLYDNGAAGAEHWTWGLGTYPAQSGRAASLNQALAQIKDTLSPLVIDGQLQMSGNAVLHLVSH